MERQKTNNNIITNNSRKYDKKDGVRRIYQIYKRCPNNDKNKEFLQNKNIYKKMYKKMNSIIFGNKEYNRL